MYKKTAEIFISLQLSFITGYIPAVQMAFKNTIMKIVYQIHWNNNEKKRWRPKIVPYFPYKYNKYLRSKLLRERKKDIIEWKTQSDHQNKKSLFDFRVKRYLAILHFSSIEFKYISCGVCESS